MYDEWFDQGHDRLKEGVHEKELAWGAHKLAHFCVESGALGMAQLLTLCALEQFYWFFFRVSLTLITEALYLCRVVVHILGIEEARSTPFLIQLEQVVWNVQDVVTSLLCLQTPQLGQSFFSLCYDPFIR